MINAAFMLVLLIYMDISGYQDHESAGFIKYRFLSILAFAFPLGLLIRGRRIKPFFYLSATVAPFSALLVIYAISHHIDWLIYASQVLWGIAFISIQVTALPYIIRNVPKKDQIEAISLSYSTFSLAAIISGIIIFTLKTIFPESFDLETVLQLIALLGFSALPFVYKLNNSENLNHILAAERKSKILLLDFDWGLILKAMIPTIIIAVGAGLTIPFIGLFFFKIHGVEAENFSFLAAVSMALVFLSVLFVPKIKSSMGYRKAIPLTQGIAIVALIAFATTELYNFHQLALFIAVVCYLIRQPLMNLAGPMTSELTMNYVGKRNQEIVSALSASIWSGSWFISSLMFEIMRKNSIEYVNIFLITAGLYTLGVVLYIFLIRDYEKRVNANLIEV
jgi:predicted MFS family arabinose efflux permease